MPPATSRIPLIGDGDREMDDTPHSVPSDVGILDRNSLRGTSPAGGHHREDVPQTRSTLPQLSIESVTRQATTSREAVRCREKRQRRKERERLLREVTSTAGLLLRAIRGKARKRRVYLLASMTTVVVAVHSGIYEVCASSTRSIYRITYSNIPTTYLSIFS